MLSLALVRRENIWSLLDRENVQEPAFAPEMSIHA
jgi:hypothetical protein